jgi:hypothetical protein
LIEFKRLSHDHSRQGSQLMSRAHTPGWLFAEAAQQAGKPLQQSGNSSSRDGSDPAAAEAAESPVAADSTSSDAAAAAAAAGGASEASRSSLDSQLVRHVKSRHLHMVSLHMVTTNTLSRLQLAKLFVSFTLYLLKSTEFAISWGP